MQCTCTNEVYKLNQYKMILDHSAIVSKTDLNGTITYVNDTFCKISGYSREELIGENHRIIKYPDNQKYIYEDIWNTIKNKKVWQGTIKNRKKSGEIYYVKSTILPIVNFKNEIVEYIAARIDVTELIRKDKIIHNQFTDPLTKLQNRASLIYGLNEKIQQKASLTLINIDRFSNINDSYGYEVGDAILTKLAEILKSKHQNSYRISGDEFAMLCEHELDKNAKIEITNLIDELESTEYFIEDLKISLFLSCGVAYGKRKEIYKLSHIALKDNQRNNQKVTFFNENPDLQNRIKENIEIISKIKDAINTDKFIAYYQGIVDNRTKQIVKYESLIRLRKQHGEIESPGTFLEYAKKAKLYTQLTKIMLEKVFQKFADTKYSFSINFTLEDIESKDVVESLINNLCKYECGERTIIEIVESEGIENFESVLDFIQTIKAFGCKIAIDDFGTGYSNFAYLGKLDIDFVKIDGSLIKGIHNEGAERATIESILHFTKKMDIQTIAEFVEDEATYSALCNLGVDFSQGYYFSKPQKELL